MGSCFFWQAVRALETHQGWLKLPASVFLFTPSAHGSHLKRGNLSASSVQFTYLTQTAVHKARFKAVFLVFSIDSRLLVLATAVEKFEKKEKNYAPSFTFTWVLKTDFKSTHANGVRQWSKNCEEGRVEGVGRGSYCVRSIENKNNKTRSNLDVAGSAVGTAATLILTSPICLWTTVVNPWVWHYSCCHFCFWREHTLLNHLLLSKLGP